MKKRRTLIIAALLVAVLALGIGYAALSRELVIGSEANLAPNADDFDIVFTSANIDDTTLGSASLTGTLVDGGSTAAHYTLTGLSKAGEKAVMTFTITNRTTDVEASLVSLSTIPGTLYVGEGTSTPGTPGDYFDKKVVVKDSEGNVIAESEYTTFKIAAGDTATVEITVTLKQTVTEKITLTGASVVLNFSGEGGNAAVNP